VVRKLSPKKTRGQGMARAYSEDLRGRALDMVDKGHTLREVSETLQLGLTTIKRWVSMWRTENRRTAKTGYQKGHSHKLKDVEKLKEIMALHPDKTLKEIGNMLPVPCAAETVRRGLKRLGMTYKKKSFITNNGMLGTVPPF
jgi:transposase